MTRLKIEDAENFIKNSELSINTDRKIFSTKLKLYYKVAELNNFSFGDNNSTMFFIRKFIDEDVFGTAILSIDKILLYKDCDNNTITKFNGEFAWRITNTISDRTKTTTITFENSPFTLKEISSVYRIKELEDILDRDYFLNEMDDIILNVYEQINQFMERKIIK